MSPPMIAKWEVCVAVPIARIATSAQRLGVPSVPASKASTSMASTTAPVKASGMIWLVDHGSPVRSASNMARSTNARRGADGMKSRQAS